MINMEGTPNRIYFCELKISNRLFIKNKPKKNSTKNNGG